MPGMMLQALELRRAFRAASWMLLQRDGWLGQAALRRCRCDHPMMHQWRSMEQEESGKASEAVQRTRARKFCAGVPQTYVYMYIYIFYVTLQMHQMRFHDGSEVGFHMLSHVCACACSFWAQFESIFEPFPLEFEFPGFDRFPKFWAFSRLWQMPGQTPKCDSQKITSCSIL